VIPLLVVVAIIGGAGFWYYRKRQRNTPSFSQFDLLEQDEADQMIDGGPSVLYDAVYIPGGKESAATLAADGDAVHFIDEAFKHCKAIAATGEGVDVLLASHIAPPSSNGTSSDSKGLDQIVQALGSVIANRDAGDVRSVAQQFIKAVAQHRDWSRQSSTGPAAGMVPVPA